MIAVTAFEVPAWGDASLIELIWTFIGVFAFAFAAADFKQAWMDWQEVNKSKANGVVREFSLGYVRRAVIRQIQSLSIIAVGIYACLQPAPGGLHNVITIGGLLITGALLTIGAGIVVIAVSDFKQRRHIQEYIDREAAKNASR